MLELLFVCADKPSRTRVWLCVGGADVAWVGWGEVEGAAVEEDCADDKGRHPEENFEVMEAHLCQIEG
jgi:hypothetical protein